MDSIKNFDTDFVNSHVFHPRTENPTDTTIKRLLIDVDENITIGASFFEAEKIDPFILYFHGNGETVPDYDDLGKIFVKHKINFMPVDYRGYGFSNGTPGLVNLLEDALKIFEYVKKLRKENSFTGPLAIMGRSLGSAPAIEIAYRTDSFDALIIESGFSDFKRLMHTLGVYEPELERLADPFYHKEKIKKVLKPFLVIHGRNDEIISFSQGKELYNLCGSASKKFVEIREAGHNTIFLHGLETYFESIKTILNDIRD